MRRTLRSITSLLRPRSSPLRLRTIQNLIQKQRRFGNAAVDFMGGPYGFTFDLAGAKLRQLRLKRKGPKIIRTLLSKDPRLSKNILLGDMAGGVITRSVLNRLIHTRYRRYPWPLKLAIVGLGPHIGGAVGGTIAGTATFGVRAGKTALNTWEKVRRIIRR